MLKIVSRWALYLCYLSIIVYAVLYFGFWTTYRDSLLQMEPLEQARERLEPPRHIDADTMRLLGSVHQSKASSFVNFEQAKPAGKIRVCALGDSNTQGDEVGVRHDYPSYLQRIFHRRGFDQVEVLNFGNGWFGFSQIYVMWKKVATKFDCDYALLLPMGFWTGRDITFNHTRGQVPAYLHARLVLEKDELRLIAPIGTTAEERLEEYVRAIPHWQYLRHDRHPPNILNSPLPGGRNVPNPLYYDLRPGREEVVRIYAKIMRAIATDGPQLAVLFRGKQQELYPLIISPEAVDIGAALLSESRRFPYYTPAGHPSAWGQEVTALAFFELLTGGNRTDFSLVNVADVSAPTNTAPKALHSYQQIWLEYLGERAGYFVKKGETSHYNHDAHIGVFRRQKIAALLALARTGGSIAEACLVPLHDVPSANAEVIFESGNGKRERQSFGTIEQTQPGIAIYTVSVPSWFDVSCLPASIDGKVNQPPGNGRLILNDVAIARLVGEQIEPEHRSMLKLSDSGEHLASIESLSAPGTMDIVLKNDDGTMVRRPLLAVVGQVSRDYLDIKLPVRNAIKISTD